MKYKQFFIAFAFLLSLIVPSYAGDDKKAEQAEDIIEVTDAEFAKVTSKGIVLIDFWAVWCAPCRIQGKILHELAPEVKDVATIGKLNIDLNKNSAQKYFIRSIPTMLLFKDGKILKRYVGVQNKEDLRRDILKAANE